MFKGQDQRTSAVDDKKSARSNSKHWKKCCNSRRRFGVIVPTEVMLVRKIRVQPAMEMRLYSPLPRLKRSTVFTDSCGGGEGRVRGNFLGRSHPHPCRPCPSPSADFYLRGTMLTGGGRGEALGCLTSRRNALPPEETEILRLPVLWAYSLPAFALA